jgi:hypothetical protein
MQKWSVVIGGGEFADITTRDLGISHASDMTGHCDWLTASPFVNVALVWYHK